MYVSTLLGRLSPKTGNEIERIGEKARKLSKKRGRKIGKFKRIKK